MTTKRTAQLWLPAAEALELMQVRPQTLYASVSRGRIRAKPDAADPRRSLYHRDDVQRIAARARGRRSSETVASEAIQWGEPVLASAVSTVAEGRLLYRGQDACVLAGHATLEEVAGLLWESPSPRFAASSAVALPGTQAAPLQAGLLALASRAATDLPSRGRSRSVLQAEAADAIGALADALLGAAPARDVPLHMRLASAWRRPRAADDLRRALVLLADHELNASTFAARVTASTGASVSACLLTGLSTLTGPLHGGASAAVQALMRSAAAIGAEAAVREWLAHDRPLAAFGHPLYPQGDARCRALLANIELPPAFGELRDIGEKLLGDAVNIDFALAALAAVHRLPAGAPLTLFALARTVGWTAHVLEQQATGQLIRPRARYTGPGVAQPG
ncbi:citrate synthase [Variovorax sp. NFACC27]|uniref:citrate synthase n=1 Tax=unclassified Variovorax TaxID=663243 RepID=UPI0008986248|nr:citrate synthase [Variovorax sp. NFACC28]SEG12434.1 citrate synthase [Variovorax sp. NFACC29]SFC06328.1 citrate synthase [Variovorax sp. NFACC26]SFH07438.1 citrate synthase [Variovorax sp. NFACC27]